MRFVIVQAQRKILRYGFIGWSEDPNRDEAEYSIDDLSNDNLPFGMVLYAVWTETEE